MSHPERRTAPFVYTSLTADKTTKLDVRALEPEEACESCQELGAKSVYVLPHSEEKLQELIGPARAAFWKILENSKNQAGACSPFLDESNDLIENEFSKQFGRIINEFQSHLSRVFPERRALTINVGVRFEGATRPLNFPLEKWHVDFQSGVDGFRTPMESWGDFATLTMYILLQPSRFFFEDLFPGGSEIDPARMRNLVLPDRLAQGELAREEFRPINSRRLFKFLKTCFPQVPDVGSAVAHWRGAWIQNVAVTWFRILSEQPLIRNLWFHLTPPGYTPHSILAFSLADFPCQAGDDFVNWKDRFRLPRDGEFRVAPFDKPEFDQRDTLTQKQTEVGNRGVIFDSTRKLHRSVPLYFDESYEVSQVRRASLETRSMLLSQSEFTLTQDFFRELYHGEHYLSDEMPFRIYVRRTLRDVFELMMKHSQSNPETREVFMNSKIEDILVTWPTDLDPVIDKMRIVVEDLLRANDLNAALEKTFLDLKNDLTTSLKEAERVLAIENYWKAMWLFFAINRKCDSLPVSVVNSMNREIISLLESSFMGYAKALAQVEKEFAGYDEYLLSMIVMFLRTVNDWQNRLDREFRPELNEELQRFSRRARELAS